MPEKVELGNGVGVACTVTGEGAPLLLIHGAEGSHRMFDAIAPVLALHFRVIAYDQRDCGETENPAGATTLADLADDAVALLQALGHHKAHVYGTSFGGRVAQAIAHLHPKCVDHLVLGSTWPLPLELEQLNPDGVRAIYALREKLPDTAEELAAYFLPESFLALHPELRGIFKTALPTSERSQRRRQTVADHPLLSPREITVPTLLIAGDLDRVVPPEVTLAMTQEIRECQQVLLEGIGHAGALQAPKRIAHEVVRFCLDARAATEVGT